VPRNLGRRGMKEISVVEPGAPEIETVCCGSCDVVYVTWKPSLKGDVISYNILYDDDSSLGDYTYLEDAGNNVEGYVQRHIVPNKTWFFKVQAINAYGYATSADFESIMVVNKTTPEAPTGLAASGGADTTFVAEPNLVRLVWPEATTNKDSAKLLTCSDGSTREQKTMPGSERRYYRVYRGKTADFDPMNSAESTLILDENSTIQPTVNGTALDFVDNQAANCEPYHYRIQVVDHCARNAAWNSPAQQSVGESDFYPAIGTAAIEGQAQSNVPPAKPIGLNIANTACTGVNCDVTLTWSAVTKEDGNPSGPDIFVERYDVLIDKQDGSGNWAPELPQSTENGATTIILSDQKSNEFYRYRVRAKHCVDGPESEPIYFPCAFSTTIGVSVANFGGDGLTAGTPWMVSSPASVGVTTSLPVEKIEMWVEQGGSPLGAIQEAGPGSGATFGLPQLVDDEVAVIYVRATDANGCSGLETRFVMDEAPPPCPTTGSVKVGNTITYNVTNSSGQQLIPKRIKIVWDKAKTPTPNKDTVIASVKFNGINATTVSNTSLDDIIFTGTYLAPDGVPVGGTQTNYPIAIAFFVAANKTLAINPIDSVCVEYQTAQGDLFTCGVVEPGTVSAACSIP
ncbi:MAG: fibronectin type III domain-containing protein, partial [Acidobacteria bacterium]|nr:fibronectin type III domain-containing protein [Acidobacteriota bacterium]